MLLEPEPDCFSLGCLYCDAPTTETYCSQRCRLAETDIIGSSFSEPASPQSITGFFLPSPQSSMPKSTPKFSNSFFPSTASPKTATKFCLAPAYDFSSHRKSSVQTESTRSPKLSPSSSRSSLKNELSVQAQNDLTYYTNAFDRSREWKRRITH